MPRTRVDDEEALIPRSDQEEYHAVRKKPNKRCNCCSLKCCFFLFLLLVVATAIMFYFIYPSFVHDNFDKFMGLACGGYAGLSLSSVTCIIETSPANIATKAAAVNNTWAQNCSETYFIYQRSEENKDTNLNLTKIPHLLAVDDLGSFEYLNTVFNKSNPTSWYLRADDNTYISYIRLNKHLEPKSANLKPTYMGNKLKESEDSLGPYVVNLKMVKKIHNEYTNFMKAKEVDALTRNPANVTLVEIDSFSIDYPIKTDQSQEVKSSTIPMAFRNVSPEQMYTLYAISAESIPSL